MILFLSYMNVGASLLFIFSAIYDVISNISSVFLTLNQRSYEIEEDDNVVSVNLTNAIFLECSIGGRALVRISVVCELLGT